MIKIKKEKITAAKKKVIDRLLKKHGGLIPPEELVRDAAQPSHPFHKDFEWDDGEAAQNWRLHQARNILRVFVTMIGSNGDAKECRMFVSLSSDRERGGGYRATIDVLHNDKLRETMLEDARAELAIFRTKYAILNELAGVIREIDRVLVFSGNGKK